MEQDRYIVDRIEENYVVLENGKDNVFNVKKSDIIGNVKEGDILYIKNNLYFIDEKATKMRKEEIDNLMKGLWEE
ncbi:DUF3006 domain-containing protein [Clostridium sp. Sa3CUN1]|uniref:DUF3006 domain-containing protein n=1 Tax=Clostridium gallinarum TaxID=2762246 RepID=A0ABR8Q081_9CLOT|nr:DUF3006 domain-containing protein [Clostridium gallinarum]MBD7913827.1 DUF3006 domain-containing protein [Clostridium gallinarum]